ncbi:molybdate ABC transporter substrate-binding protein [Corynebacterium pseudotuberculosis]|uniref:molybdate ABC transporter substrate-binding protein n=1 Tax=Corynebacterium pseudotuberculosis TaxID=1719 RepID=UPI00090B7DD9|nr:molybdate ABC transporter substrate-binding protein [Corynebacterium pseudotuberculosis]APG81093.1 Molybdate transport system solute-binding [Corynebacterium pseudotuberculosis]ASA48259.2 molybdate ABC transporter substrate-binding protein [Corynebacterium pseudotuberculosis Cp162]WFP67561.1 molybdate ABC transporter substrate-binding protein [Corynebacterium pseudotuberculosis]
MKLARTVGAAASVLFLAGCSGIGDNADVNGEASSIPTTLTVFAAASTRVINNELSALASPLTLRYNNGGSAALVQQMREGAPADVFISADKKNMDKAISDGTIHSSIKVATNTMVMVVPKINPAKIASLADLPGKTVVLCDVQVPCGTISKKLQDANGIDVQAASLESSVSDVLGKVVSGEADAGWVYRTDAAAAHDAVETLDIPHSQEFENSIYAGISSNSASREEANKLLDLIASPEMAKVWKAHGFSPAT